MWSRGLRARREKRASPRRAQQEAILGELRRLLHGTPLRLVALYLAERLGCDQTGRFTIELRVEEGGLRRAWVRRGPIGAEELEQLGAT